MLNKDEKELNWPSFSQWQELFDDRPSQEQLDLYDDKYDYCQTIFENGDYCAQFAMKFRHIKINGIIFSVLACDDHAV